MPNKNIFLWRNSLGNTVQLNHLCSRHVWALWSTQEGPLGRPGWPLHPIPAVEGPAGQWWAAGFGTLAVTTCDLGVSWQAAGLLRGLGGSMAWGSGKQMSQKREEGGHQKQYKIEWWWTTGKSRGTMVHLPLSRLTGSQLKQMLHLDLVTQMLQRHCLY